MADYSGPNARYYPYEQVPAHARTDNPEADLIGEVLSTLGDARRTLHTLTHYGWATNAVSDYEEGMATALWMMMGDMEGRLGNLQSFIRDRQYRA